MTTNKYQLIQDLLKAFLWATEKTLVPQMLTCTAKGIRKNFLKGGWRAKKFSHIKVRFFCQYLSDADFYYISKEA